VGVPARVAWRLVSSSIISFQDDPVVRQDFKVIEEAPALPGGFI
jgi:hypothetical protein